MSEQAENAPQVDANARHLASAVTVALRAARDDARRLAALNRIADVIIGAPGLGAMCDRALDVLTDVLGAGVGIVFVFDDEAPPDRALRMVAWCGLSGDAAAADAGIPLGSGIAGQAAARRKVVIHYDAAARPDGRPTSRRAAGETRVAAPMLVCGHLIGTLVIARQGTRAWSRSDLSLLRTVASQLATALEAEQLRAAAASAAAAREANRLKSELLANVSHELRTPLGAIKGFASGLRSYGHRLTAEEQIESLRLIDEAADRLTELVDNILDLQRLDSGRLDMRRGSTDLTALAATVVQEMVPRAPSHVFELLTVPRLPPVCGDARRLRQVVQNLIENAVKYSPSGGAILLRLSAPCADHVELRVQDPGIGIPADQLQAIFERFYRVDNAATRSIGGTGLGLAIARGLVIAHGGTMYAESGGEGRGSTFVVTLPAMASTMALPDGYDARRVDMPLSSQRVIVRSTLHVDKHEGAAAW